MFSHVTVGTNDVSRAIRFYDAVFSVLGIPRYRGDIQSGYAGWGRPDDPKFWVFPPFDEKRKRKLGTSRDDGARGPSRPDDCNRKCRKRTKVK